MTVIWLDKYRLNIIFFYENPIGELFYDQRNTSVR